MTDCIFCRIVQGQAPSYKVFEDKEHIGILDIYPNIEGQTLVITKAHRSNYVFESDDKTLTKLILATKQVARLLEERLPVKRVHLVFEGTEVDHLHAKLYPAKDFGADKVAITNRKDRRRFQSYPGYVTTLLGPRALDA